MRRVVCHAFGPPETLVIEESDPLEPGPGQVVVDVRAAGVNFVDALIAAGGYQIKPPLPYVPGGEVAGVVSAVGEGVDASLVGQRVMSSIGLMGGFAEQACLPAAAVTVVPDAIPFGIAATLAQNYCTMTYSLTRCDSVQPGETVLVLGAGGGIGLAAVDIAASLGATVIAAASSAEKLAVATSVGATATIDYSTEDLKVRAKELSDGGVDIVVDPVGGPLAEAALRATRWCGRFHVLGFASGEIPRIPINLVLLNNRRMIGVEWGAWAMRNRDAQAVLLQEVLDGVASGRLHPPAPAEHPLEEAPAVLRAFMERRVAGKVALVP